VEFYVVRHRRLSYLLPVLIFVALRALAHANPAPLPWSSGVFDGQGVDDLLQSIRFPYARSTDVHRVSSVLRTPPTERVMPSEPKRIREFRLATAAPRAPPPGESCWLS
jgi:hypothetical protein